MKWITEFPRKNDPCLLSCFTVDCYRALVKPNYRSNQNNHSKKLEFEPGITAAPLLSSIGSLPCPWSKIYCIIQDVGAGTGHLRFHYRKATWWRFGTICPLLLPGPQMGPPVTLTLIVGPAHEGWLWAPSIKAYPVCLHSKCQESYSASSSYWFY